MTSAKDKVTNTTKESVGGGFRLELYSINLLAQIVHQDDYILNEVANPLYYNKSVHKYGICFFHMIY